MSVLSLRHECLYPGMRAQALVPRHEGIRAYAQATWWNVHNLIFDLVFSFSVPTTFEHKGISACTWAWALVPWHGHLFPGASACTQSFYIPPPHLWVQEVNFLKLQQVGFECPHHLWLYPPLKLHSYKSKIIIHRSHHLPKFWVKTLKQAQIQKHETKTDEITLQQDYSTLLALISVQKLSPVAISISLGALWTLPHIIIEPNSLGLCLGLGLE